MLQTQTFASVIPLDQTENSKALENAHMLAQYRVSDIINRRTSGQQSTWEQSTTQQRIDTVINFAGLGMQSSTLGVRRGGPSSAGRWDSILREA